MHDVIIIGAGLAGLAAAQTCKAAGLDTIVLEASNRIGGRVWSAPAPSSKRFVDWGAEWVIPTMHHEVMTLVNENNLELMEDDPSTNSQWNTSRRSFSGTYVDLQKSNAAFANALLRIEQDAAAWLSGGRVEMSPETAVRTYFQTITADFETVEWLEAALFPLTGADPEKLATLMLWSEIGFHNNSIDETLNASTKRIAQGCGALATALQTKLPDCVHFNETTTRVSQFNNACCVETDKTTYEAQYCIVATPLMTLQRIVFEPPLPQHLSDTAKNSNVGRVAKTWALVNSEIPLGDILSSTSQLRYGYVLKMNARNFLVCGQILSDADSPVSTNMAVDLVRASWPSAEVIDTAIVDWTHEPFAKASWHSGRAGWAGKTALFNTPIGNMHFAGGDIAEHWAGWMEGALRSGKAAGQRVVSASKS